MRGAKVHELTVIVTLSGERSSLRPPRGMLLDAGARVRLTDAANCQHVWETGQNYRGIDYFFDGPPLFDWLTPQVEAMAGDLEAELREAGFDGSFGIVAEAAVEWTLSPEVLAMLNRYRNQCDDQL